MGAILMDNWSVEDAAAYIRLAQPFAENKEIDFMYDIFMPGFLSGHENEAVSSLNWNNFLVAILLWDEIWLFSNNAHHLWDTLIHHVADKRLAEALNSMKHLIHSVDDDMINPELKIEAEHLKGGLDGSLTIKERTGYYKILSNSLGIDFFGHHKRWEHIHNNYYENRIFNRLDIFHTIDKELITYCERINEKLGNKRLTFKYPVLFDFIRSGTNSHAEELERTLTLRKEEDIVSFRNEMYYLEEVINKGNLPLLERELDRISEFSEEITNKYRKNKVFLGEIEISLAPSITVPFSFKQSDRELHTTFIRRMMEYGLYNRSRKP